MAIDGSGPHHKLDGCKVVRVRFSNGRPVGGYDDFITGFGTTGNGRLQVWGTPSQLAVAQDGSPLVVDDKAAVLGG